MIKIRNRINKSKYSKMNINKMMGKINLTI